MPTLKIYAPQKDLLRALKENKKPRAIPLDNLLVDHILALDSKLRPEQVIVIFIPFLTNGKVKAVSVEINLFRQESRTKSLLDLTCKRIAETLHPFFGDGYLIDVHTVSTDSVIEGYFSLRSMEIGI